jgi:cytochrome oxidase Cu insertion factor (SCO1/SenC/PrrC family)
LTEVRNSILGTAGLAPRVRFVSISLDPTIDTPEAIGRYREMVTRGSAMEWNVLTARSVRELLPVLSDFGQDVSVDEAPDGTARRTVHHMLKMFLIDRAGVVREIYTLAYLQPAVIANDIRTLYLEETAQVAPSRPELSAGSTAPGGGGH